jgi:hypothetical protein
MQDAGRTQHSITNHDQSILLISMWWCEHGKPCLDSNKLRFSSFLPRVTVYSGRRGAHVPSKFGLRPPADKVDPETSAARRHSPVSEQRMTHPTCSCMQTSQQACRIPHNHVLSPRHSTSFILIIILDITTPVGCWCQCRRETRQAQPTPGLGLPQTIYTPVAAPHPAAVSIYNNT